MHDEGKWVARGWHMARDGSHGEALRRTDHNAKLRIGWGRQDKPPGPCAKQRTWRGTEGCTNRTRRRVEEAVISAQAMRPGHHAQQHTTTDFARQDQGGTPLRAPTWTVAAKEANLIPLQQLHPNADSNEKTRAAKPVAPKPNQPEPQSLGEREVRETSNPSCLPGPQSTGKLWAQINVCFGKFFCLRPGTSKEPSKEGWGALRVMRHFGGSVVCPFVDQNQNHNSLASEGAKALARWA